MNQPPLTIKQYFKINYGEPVFLPVNYHRFKLKTGLVPGPITANEPQEIILMDKAIKITDKAIDELPEPLKTIALLRYAQGRKAPRQLIIVGRVILNSLKKHASN